VSGVLLAAVFCGGVATADVVCDEVRAAEIEVALSSAPADPLPGDVVDLHVQIVNTSGGSADIPLFQLVGAEPLFAIEAQENSYPLVEFAHYRLRALRPGQAALHVSVNFATSHGCSDLPVFVFRAVRSLPYVIAVHGEAPAASATPTATPAPVRPAAGATRTARQSPQPGRTSAASPHR
jgi:hypothetical protein